MRWLGGITDSVDMGLGRLSSCWWTGRLGVLRFTGSQRVRHDWATELNWTGLCQRHQLFMCWPSNLPSTSIIFSHNSSPLSPALLYSLCLSKGDDFQMYHAVLFTEAILSLNAAIWYFSCFQSLSIFLFTSSYSTFLLPMLTWLLLKVSEDFLSFKSESWYWSFLVVCISLSFPLFIASY